ncbi:hypothetical protein CK516_07845 [Nostoc sp. 'Peltigera malacea cyanobiont' DB3992]|nr:hypothetical protein CK516_07845 [Nostoc sp. 'Peltigera malacea cyanobiont' DB3992]
MPKFLCWALLFKTALVYFQQEQFLIFKKKEFRNQNGLNAPLSLTELNSMRLLPLQRNKLRAART